VRVELHPDARAELRSAAIWYDEQRFGLGDELIDEVSLALTRIAAMPASFPVWPGTSTATVSIRRALVSRFPHGIAFQVHSEHILVLAIQHSKRRPQYWLARTF
jgi:plasmid stabilization system protein ParE